MNSQKLLSDIEMLWHSLKIETANIQCEEETIPSLQSELMITDNAIRIIKEWIINHNFDDWKSEIIFFKYWKPLFISKFIFISKKIDWFATAPFSTAKNLKNNIRTHIINISNFYSDNKDFLSYYRRGATHLDKQYFLRYRYDLNNYTDGDFHCYDDRFSTSHDILLAKIKAYEEFEKFIEKNNKLKEAQPKLIKNIRWTASKSALTELIFALHKSQCINAGSIELSELVRCIEQTFNINLGNYHKIMGDIKLRKNDQTKFIKTLNDNLNNYIEKSNAFSP